MPFEAKATILNVNDDPSGRYVTTRILRRGGFEVLEACSGQEALELLREQPDLVLLDVNLPDMNGREVCRAIKSRDETRSIPVLHLSAISTSAEDCTAGLEHGADGYLTQPVDPTLLVATVKALLRMRQAERREREAARFWQVTFDSISHGVCLIDADGRVQRVNRAMTELLGKPAEELTGLTHKEALGNAFLPPGEWPFERVRRTGRRESAEIEVNGRWFHVTADPVTGPDGAFAGAVRTIVEITARKQAESEREKLLRQLEDEHARLEAVLEHMPSAVLIAEAPSGKLVSANKQVSKVFGGPFRLGGGVEDYLQYPMYRPDGKPYTAEQVPLARTLASGEVVTNEEISVERPDHTRIALLASSAPVLNRDGFIVAAVSAMHDVTDRKQLEEQLKQATKMEAMGRLAGGVAHDFNNLLTIIGGYGQMVQDALEPKSPLRRDMEAIMEASTRATALTRQLLQFSRRQIVQPKVFDLNRHVSKMNRMLRRVIGEDVELRTSLEAKSARIKADPAQIEQILLNIAVNARDAMANGGRLTIRTKDVTVTGRATDEPRGLEPGKYVLLSMADNGSGMTPETQSRLFEPFFTTKGKGKGTGLGLSTVYGIVKQAGGDITVRSELGRGTEVRVFLPTTTEASKAVHAPEPQPLLTGSEMILLVEDEAEVRRLANEMLSRQGYKVIEAASGREALRLWDEHKNEIDLVLTDVIMPQMSGPEMANKLKAAHPGLKVIYMSGYAGDVIAKHGVSEASTDFIHKPFTLEVLARKVRSVLDQKSGA